MTSPPDRSASGESLSTSERMARLLGVVPWVISEGRAHLDEIAARFDYPRDVLLKDLTEVLFFVGVHPFTPDTLIEVFVEDDVVVIYVGDKDWFSRPLRLTEAQAARLLTVGRSVLAMSEAFGDPEIDAEVEAAPLTRALAKLSLALGDGIHGADKHMEVHLGHAPAATLDAVRKAAAQRLRIEIEYYSLGRDVLTARAVDPTRVFSHDGAWYLFGWCHRAGAERVFRVDRIRSLTVTDAEAQFAPPAGEAPSVDIGEGERSVAVRLSPQGAWVADYHPTQERSELGDGRIDATLAVTSTPWLARLLVQLGPHAEVVACDEAADADLRARTASRILERYQR